MESKKIQMNLYKTERVTDVENKLMVTGELKGRDKLEDWATELNWLIYKINNKGALYSTGNSTQYFVITYVRK